MDGDYAGPFYAPTRRPSYSLKNKKTLSHAEFRDLARSVLGRTQAEAAE